MVSGAFSGMGIDGRQLCQQSPWKVPLDQTALSEIAAQQNISRAGIFVRRLVEKLGATTSLTDEELGAKSKGSFIDLVQTIQSNASTWVTWDVKAECIADKFAEKDDIENAIKTVCSSGCPEIPRKCQATIWDRANFIFGDHY